MGVLQVTPTTASLSARTKMEEKRLISCDASFLQLQVAVWWKGTWREDIKRVAVFIGNQEEEKRKNKHLYFPVKQ